MVKYKILEFIDFDNFVVRAPSTIPGKYYLMKRVQGVDYCECKGFKYRRYCHHFSDLFKDPILKPIKIKVDELLGRKPTESVEVDVEGWKGESGVYIYESGDKFEVIEWRKRKKDGEIINQRHTVKKTKVQGLWYLLDGLRTKHNTVTFRYGTIVKEIIDTLNLKSIDHPGDPCGVDEFNGGKCRSRYYFKYYYYPMKVLEIHYGAVEFNDKDTTLVQTTIERW